MLKSATLPLTPPVLHPSLSDTGLSSRRSEVSPRCAECISRHARQLLGSPPARPPRLIGLGEGRRELIPHWRKHFGLMAAEVRAVGGAVGAACRALRPDCRAPCERERMPAQHGHAVRRRGAAAGRCAGRRVRPCRRCPTHRRVVLCPRTPRATAGPPSTGSHCAAVEMDTSPATTSVEAHRAQRAGAPHHRRCRRLAAGCLRSTTPRRCP